MSCQHITWKHRHEILVTSWAQPKLTPSIYVTARDDRAKIAYNFFFFFLSQLIVFLWSKREEVGVAGGEIHLTVKGLNSRTCVVKAEFNLENVLGLPRWS